MITRGLFDQPGIHHAPALLHEPTQQCKRDPVGCTLVQFPYQPFQIGERIVPHLRIQTPSESPSETLGQVVEELRSLLPHTSLQRPQPLQTLA